MTKKEKEILKGIIDRSGEKKANPAVIAEAIALLFTDGGEEVKKELEKAIAIARREKNNEDTI